MKSWQRVNEVAKKLLEIKEAFSYLEKALYDNVATLSGDVKEWECEPRYFNEDFHWKMEAVARMQQWIENWPEKSSQFTAPKLPKKMKIL